MDWAALSKKNSLSIGLELHFNKLGDLKDLVESKIIHLKEKPQPRADVSKMEKELVVLAEAHEHLKRAIEHLKTI